MSQLGSDRFAQCGESQIGIIGKRRLLIINWFSIANRNDEW